MKPTYYLDANASVPLHPLASNALVDALALTGNPSSPHLMGRKLRRRLDEARQQVASALGGGEKELVFTSGASEGNRWAVAAVRGLAAKMKRKIRVVSTSLEHPSMAKPLAEAVSSGAVELSLIPICRQGQWDLSAVDLAKADVLITTAAHNETGLLAPLEALEKALPEDAIWVLDAAQSFARQAIPPRRADLVVVSGHKVGAPSGCGALLIRNRARALPPPLSGGGQEAGLRPGTEAWVLHAAFGAVCGVINDIREENQKLGVLRDELERDLLAAWPAAQALFVDCPRLPNTSALVLPGVNGEALRMAIDASGVCVGFGAACSALAPEPSAALLSLGLSPQEARATVRVSLPIGATLEGLQAPVSDLKKVGQRLLQK